MAPSLNVGTAVGTNEPTSQNAFGIVPSIGNSTFPDFNQFLEIQLKDSDSLRSRL